MFGSIMMQAELETARADGQALQAQLTAEVEAKSTLEKARAAAVQVRPWGCSSFAADQDHSALRSAWRRLRPLLAPAQHTLPNTWKTCSRQPGVPPLMLLQLSLAETHGSAACCYLYPAPAGAVATALKHGTNAAACQCQGSPVGWH